MTRICIVGVKYSANLGDGVIADCLQHALRRADPSVEVTAVDLAGRRAYGDGLNRSRARLLTALAHIPQPVRRGLVRLLLTGLARARLRPRWAAALEGCDAVVLGGGQLLADTDLNFPIKVRAFLGLAAQAGLPVAVHGVGVGGGWSRAGGRLFRTALASIDLRAFAVRDRMSRDRAITALGDLLPVPVQLCPDPAVLVHEAYGVPLRRAGQGRRIGLCVAHPEVLGLHADAGPAAMPVADFYLALMRALADRGEQPVCFTNGAGEDDSFLRQQLLPRVAAEGLADRVTLAARPAEPRALVALIGGLDAVIAHRLHASIIAYGLRVPHVGLNWDSKVRSFYAEVGRPRFVVEPQDAVPATVLERLDEALAAGIDSRIWEDTVARAHAGARDLVAALARPADLEARAREDGSHREAASFDRLGMTTPRVAGRS